MNKKRLKVMAGLICIAGLLLPQCRQEPLSVVVTPVITPTPASIPSLNVITAEPRTVDVTKVPIAAGEGSSGTRYVFPEWVSVIARLPDGRFLARITEDNLSGFANTIAIVSVDDSLISSIFQNVRPKVLTPPEDDRVFIAVDVPPGQPIPVWAVDMEGGEPVFLSTTGGFSLPLYSATADGRVLLLEKGHLVLKWIEAGTVHSQSLPQIEEKLSLNWSSVDLTQAPDFENIPLVDISISPNGQWVALFDGLRAKLWVVSIDGETVSDVSFPAMPATPGKGSWVTFLNWSPDSQLLGYKATIWQKVYRQSEYFSVLQVVAVGNETPASLTSGGMIGVALAWSPEGQHLAVANRVEYSSTYHLSISDRNGANPQEISNVYFGDIAQTLFWESENSLSYKCQLPDSNVYRPDICTTVINQ